MRRRAVGAAYLAQRRRAGAGQEEPANDVSDPGPPPEAALDPVDQLKQLHELRTDGAISDAEFEDLKTRTIAAS